MGVIFGILINFLDSFESFKNTSIEIVSLGGEVFLKGNKNVGCSYCFFSLTIGVANLNDLNTLGKIGIKSICFYLLTTF